MDAPFRLFGLHHLVVLACVPLLAGLLTYTSRRFPFLAKHIRISLGILILVNELVWYGYVVMRGWFSFPYNLPLHLCDLVLWLTIYTSLRPTQWAYECSYYWGLAGTSMALLTPDISGPFFSYLTLKFFASHGLVVTALLFLTWSGISQPRPGSQWKALFWLNVYAILLGVFNLLFKTNYMYLCEKPAGATLLDHMGPWPMYIIVAETVAVGMFFLLALPFRKKSEKPNS
jgi:hypothetical integral membrane protein (TIGR02206 family)